MNQTPILTTYPIFLCPNKSADAVIAGLPKRKMVIIFVGCGHPAPLLQLNLNASYHGSYSYWQPFYAEDRVQIQASPCRVCLGQRVLGLVLCGPLHCTPYQYNSTKLHTILNVYYHYNLNFVSHNIVKIELKFKIFVHCDEWALFVFSGKSKCIRSSI